MVTLVSFSGTWRMCSRLRRAKMRAVGQQGVAHAETSLVVGGWAALAAGEGEEDLVEGCLAAGDVDGVDAGFVEGSHDVDHLARRP